MRRLRAKSPRRAYTLLEVLLALALTAVVLMIIATGIGVQLRALSASRARVERAQLARVLLHQMADDLRGALTPDNGGAGAPQTQTSTSAAEALGASSDSSDQTLSGSSGDGTSEQNAAQAESDSDAAAADTTLAGVYGQLDWLRVDVVRAIRSDSSSSASGSASGSTATSESTRQLKTIVYYVVTADEAAASAASTDTEKQPGGGLVRRELTRSVAAWAAQQGSLAYVDPSVSPMGTEVADVTAVEFRYYNGSDWVESWDTATAGSLPAAVEIRLYLAPAPTFSSEQPTLAAAAPDRVDASSAEQYRLVVPIAMSAAAASSAGGSTDASSNDAASSQSTTEPASSDSSGSGANTSGNTP